MDLNMLLKESPTSKVRILAMELLSDGNVHTRREIVQYIREKEKQYRLEHFSDGCMSGGIHQAVNGFGCEKVGSAKYRMTNIAPAVKAENVDKSPKRITVRASELCEELVEGLTVLSREIDYVNADDEELGQLNLIRECIKETKLWTQKLKSYVLPFEM